MEHSRKHSCMIAHAFKCHKQPETDALSTTNDTIMIKFRAKVTYQLWSNKNYGNYENNMFLAVQQEKTTDSDGKVPLPFRPSFDVSCFKSCDSLWLSNNITPMKKDIKLTKLLLAHTTTSKLQEKKRNIRASIEANKWVSAPISLDRCIEGGHVEHLNICYTDIKIIVCHKNKSISLKWLLTTQNRITNHIHILLSNKCAEYQSNYNI